MGVVSSEFSRRVKNRTLDETIQYLEAGLRDLKTTSFHSVLGKDFLEHSEALSKWLIEFHRTQTQAGKTVGAIYVEMNGFTINTDEWHCDAFGYEKCGDRFELQWLSKWNSTTEDHFVLGYMSEVQAAFEESFELPQEASLSYKISEEIAEHLVVAHFMNVVAIAHEVATLTEPAFTQIPVLSTAHDWQILHRS